MKKIVHFTPEIIVLLVQKWNVRYIINVHPNNPEITSNLLKLKHLDMIEPISFTVFCISFYKNSANDKFLINVEMSNRGILCYSFCWLVRNDRGLGSLFLFLLWQFLAALAVHGAGPGHQSTSASLASPAWRHSSQPSSTWPRQHRDRRQESQNTGLTFHPENTCDESFIFMLRF